MIKLENMLACSKYNLGLLKILKVEVLII